ncbi:MAG TPA: cyclopropane-fatty-acyl-phospholipid synthase family protein [Rhizomicrobium sp.]|nr:cyclopropane-fatty-acyl-phospholipid synthase family protein [Rhizomicrobium sp.]
MDLIAAGSLLAERAPVPDALLAAGMRHMIASQQRRLERARQLDFAAAMAAHPIAEHAADANAQHYELPPEFFALILGPRRKYSSCLYAAGAATLGEAEEVALSETAGHADLHDGQSILELGCGWGSLSLWMAERFPAAHITAVSNSAPQRLYIEAQAQTRRFGNLRVITADMNDFAIDRTFDRIVSVEMFEHMANWRGLLAKARGWLKPDGRLFIHVFSHAFASYRFDHNDAQDWIARHFFTGGIMPGHDLIRSFPDLFLVEQEWRWNGSHYRRTALDWLANYDRNAKAIASILRDVYGADAALWRRRWRMFFLATAELFGYAGGNVWGVSHYQLKPARI